MRKGWRGRQPMVHRAMQFEDIAGTRFGMLVAQWPVGRRGGGVYWLLVCDCGAMLVKSRALLIASVRKNCGCVLRERMTTQAERKRMHDAAYYQANKEKIIANVARWQTTNRKKARAYKRKWKRSNPRHWDTPQGAKTRAAWVRAHPENRRKAINKWRAKTRDKQTSYSHKRRALKLGLTEHFTAQQWTALKAQYNHRCLCCGEEKRLTPDHVIPLCNGGSDSIDNIQPLCSSCNSKKWRKHTDYRSSPSAA